MEWIKENLKWIAPILAGVVGVFYKNILSFFNIIRLKPKEEQEIVSQKVDDDIKVSKMAIELTVQLTAQLDKAQLVINRLQEENDRLHEVITKLRQEMGDRIDVLEAALNASIKALNEERNHCNSIRQELDRIKKQYGL